MILRALLVCFVMTVLLVAAPAVAVVPDPAGIPDIQIFETFDARKGRDHPVALEVTITHRGAEAKRLAADMDALHAAQNELFYAYRRCYPDMKLTEPGYGYNDDDGSVVVGGTFEIPKLWEKISGNSRYRACFYNQGIKDYFDEAEEALAENTSGTALWAHPVSLEKEVTITLPKSRNPYRITPESDRVENPHFTLNYARDIEGSLLTYAYRFDTNSAVVPVDDVEAFRADVDKAHTLTSACDVRYDAPYTLTDVIRYFLLGLPYALIFFAVYGIVRYFRPSKDIVALSIRDFTDNVTIDAPASAVWEALIQYTTVPYITRTVLVTENGDERAWKPEYAGVGAVIKHYGRRGFGLQKITCISRITVFEEGVRIVYEIPLQSPIVGYDAYKSSGQEEVVLAANGHGGTLLTFTVQSQVECPISLRITGKKLYRYVRRLYTRYGKALAREAQALNNKRV